MSSLSKPFIFSSKADASAQPVNADHVSHVSTFDSVNTIGGGDTSYKIIFVMTNQGQSLSRVEWSYLNETDRDDDYAGVLATVGYDVSIVS